MQHDVFISYSSRNQAAAQAVCHALEQNGIRCWIAPRDIPAGSKYGDLIDEAIKASRVVVVMFSETAASSVWVNGELNVAFSEQKTIIPFRLDETPLSGQAKVMLTQIHWIDAFPNYKTKFNDLVEAVGQAIGKNIQPDQPASAVSKTSISKRTVLVVGVVAVVACIIAFIAPIIAELLHTYSYDKNGIHVKVDNLTEEQETALTTIFDNMTLVDGGSFMMGDNGDNPEYRTSLDSLSVPAHKVNLSAYYISKYEVTQSQWKAFMNIDGRSIEDGDDKAVDKLSWEDAQAFVDTLMRKTNVKFSLPTEAQWEYAARGGQRSKGYIFAGITNDPTLVAWSSFDDLSSAHSVGGKLANELDVFDMTGNVSEWCLDRYGQYSDAETTNPQGSEAGTKRIYRGGDFLTENFYDMKTTTRFYAAPFVNRRATGMRLVINID